MTNNDGYLERLEYHQDMFELDERSGAKLSEHVLCMFDAGEPLVLIAEECGVSISETCEIVGERRD